MADDEDDDFEDLFSFGATTPGATSNGPATQPTSTGSDFDILSDVSLSTPTGVASSPAAGAPPLSAGTSGVKTPRSTGAGDEFDDLFGTPPPVTTAAPRTPADQTSIENDLLAFDDTPDAAARQSIDDFHVHDEDTRDMLEWLDDDVTGRKSQDDSSKDIASSVSADTDDLPAKSKETKVEDDDFDFDQMLAESESTENQSNKETKKILTEEKVAEPPQEVTSNNNKPDVSDDILDTAPMPVFTPPAPAGIEEELAFDQWEDDNEEMEDLQATGTVSDGQDESIEKEGGTGTTKVQKDGGSAKVNPPSPKKITFSSLSDAVRSNASTIDDVRSLFARERGFHEPSDDVGVSKEDRAHLWAKVICNKVLEDIEDGSLADSYREWEKKGEFTAKFKGEEYSAVVDPLLKQSCGLSSEDDAYEETKQQLLSLSYFQSRNNSSTSSALGIDPLIPPVALAVLQAGIPPAAASVVLSNIEPSAMPLLRLSHDERYVATKALHADFYLLACYHLPLLVMHLDRHCPGWYWPRRCEGEDNANPESVGASDDDKKDGGKKTEKEERGEKNEKEEGDGKNEKKEEDDDKGREIEAPEKKKKSNLEQNGLVPLSYFVTIFAGECGGSCMDHKNLLQLWDHILTRGDHSWKYFLAIAVLEKNSDLLLMSRGEELKKELQKILDFEETSCAIESFVGVSEGGADSTGDENMTAEWILSAKALMESTPSSAIELLRSADDRAVASALKVRQTKMDEEIQAQLDAAELARKKEREVRDKESEKALNKARLTAYYRRYNPEKVDTIDQILVVFDGRIEVLNEKLKRKYGVGFLPDQALSDQTRSFLLSVNQSIADTKKHVSVTVAGRKKKARALAESRPQTKVVLEVSTKEVIPIICTTKGHNLATGERMDPLRRTSDTDSNLQFYLVDCRPESIASEQGRFPTAVALSPEKLQDPDELQKLTEMFESLRSAVHICVMGEGFASFPVLYNHSLSKVEEKLLEDDIARTSNCALFFLKKGFPFVSILRGGFAAAHAFLSREGASMGMGPTDVLVEYDPDLSLFSQLETARQEEDRYKNAPAREKTARTLQKIIDNSMTRLTLEEQRINSLANDLAKPETVDKMKQSMSNFLAKPKTVPNIGFGRTPPLFMAKTFASTKKEGSSEKKTESTQADDKSMTVKSLTEKINFKLPSLHSESSSTALSDQDVGDSEKGNATTSGSEPASDSVPTDAAPIEKGVEGSANDNPPKASSAFTSFTQRMQQATAKATVVPATDGGEPAPENESAKKESTVGKMSFSSFTNRMKFNPQPTSHQTSASDGTDSKSSDEKKESTAEMTSTTTQSPDMEEKDGEVTSDKPSKVSSAFASFSQRMHQAKSTAVAPVSESVQPAAGDQAKKEGTVGMSFSSFKNRIKLSQQPTDQPTTPSDEVADPKVTGDKEDTESEKAETDPKAIPSISSPISGGRLNKFTKSLGGGLSGLREKAVEAKASYEKKASAQDTSNKQEDTKTAASEEEGAKTEGDKEKEVKEEATKEDETKEEGEKSANSTNSPADSGTFSKFTKSIGGGISGIRNQPRFASLLQTKPNAADPKKTEESGVIKSLSSLEDSDMAKSLTSLGKLLLEDEPLPKTRFQRMAVEESISFDHDTDDATSSTDAQGGVEDESTEDLLFADVLLSDSVDEKPVNATEAKVEE